MSRTTAVLAALFATLLVAAPSQAAATDPVVSSPAPGTVMPNRWTGAVTLNLSAAPSDEYWYDFNCDDAGYTADDDTYYYDSEVDDAVWTVAPSYPIIGPATCEATVRGVETGAYASATWTVLGPSVTFNFVALAEAPFFPIVRDGYADTSTLEWAMTADAVVSVLVTDSAGSPVKAASLGRLVGDDFDYGYVAHSWVWDGLRQDGSVVAPGDYTLTVTATGDDGIARSASKTVTAATGVRETDWKKSRRAGAQASSITRGGGCAAIYQRRGSSVTLDCTRGRRMVATWRFTLPADAVSIRYEVLGRWWGAQPRAVAKRPSAAQYQVKVRVPRGTVTRVDKVIVQYKTRTPI